MGSGGRASDAGELIEEWRGENEGVGQLVHRHPHKVVRGPPVSRIGQVPRRPIEMCGDGPAVLVLLAVARVGDRLAWVG